MHTSSFAPITYLLSSITVFHVCLHESSYQVRLLLLPFFLFFAVLSFIESDKFQSPTLTSLWAQSVALNIVHVISVILIEKCPAPQEHDGWSLSYSSAFLTTWRFWSNPQLLPEARKVVSNNKELTPEPRSVFIFLRLAKLSLYYYLQTRLLPALFSEILPEIVPSDVAQTALLSRIGDVSTREVIIRSYMSLSWIWESIMIYDGANAVLSSFTVICGIDSPADWPSLFGGLDSIRGMRSFWGTFWHRLASRPYKNCGRVVASGVSSLLGPATGSSGAPHWMEGMTVAFVVFLFSGLAHNAVSWRLGARDWLDLRWFLLNYVACLVETWALSALRRLTRRLGLARELSAIERSWLGRLVGFAWVFAFFFWSVPQWNYSRIHRALLAARH
ncbi:hypothetical protein VPNG_06477 [Cytospora leucostoma]|uniref:Wax synthase domain-containing protein n=1 Tax=Cytospora leucostoma TaxID=1230097 RepID=A0A423WZ31_9PEZI|nr:hypothetical protein VPNG_06477 [Cytospora leucostoma]